MKGIKKVRAREQSKVHRKTRKTKVARDVRKTKILVDIFRNQTTASISLQASMSHSGILQKNRSRNGNRKRGGGNLAARHSI